MKNKFDDEKFEELDKDLEWGLLEVIGMLAFFFLVAGAASAAILVYAQKGATHATEIVFDDHR